LRSHAGLRFLLGEMPSAEGVRFFLSGFHDEKLLESRPEEGAFIAAETEPLAGLWEVNREVVLKASRKEPLKEATIDQDATVVQSHKEQSQMTDLGERGYEPVINYWVEEDLILSVEFRDGNVPAEVEFIPSAASVKRDMKPDRYLAIRVRPWQGELFSDGNSYHYYAVVTNRWEMEGEELVRWQHERCGSVEKVHDVVKNDLAGGVM